MAIKPLRILHCAMFSVNKYGANYYSGHTRLSNGLIRNGHFVYNFSYRDVAREEAPLGIKELGMKKMNKRFVETAERIAADVVLLGHAEFIEAETLMEIKKRLPHCKIAMWWVDWWHNLVKYDRVMSRRMPLLDALFMTSDPEFVRENYVPTREVEKFFFMPNSCDPSMDTGRAYDIDAPLHEVLFIGRSFGSRDDLLAHFKQNMSDLNIGLYGQGRENFVTGHRYLELVSNSRIGINFNRDNSMPLYTSNRMVHLAANGCLVMTPDTPRMKEIFTPEEVVYFSSAQECEDKVRHYLAHPDEAQQTAEAGRARAHTDYDAKVITANMLASLYA